MRKRLYVDRYGPYVFTQEDGCICSNNPSTFTIPVEEFDRLMRSDVEINEMVNNDLWEAEI
jgi:hypothetical protein